MTDQATPAKVRLTDGLGPNVPERESVDDALLIVGTYGPWGADLNDAHRRQVVLADEVLKLQGEQSVLVRLLIETDKMLSTLEGESDDPARCVMIGRAVLRDLPIESDQEWPVQLTYVYQPHDAGRPRRGCRWRARRRPGRTAPLLPPVVKLLTGGGGTSFFYVSATKTGRNSK